MDSTRPVRLAAVRGTAGGHAPSARGPERREGCGDRLKRDTHIPAGSTNKDKRPLVGRLSLLLPPWKSKPRPRGGESDKFDELLHRTCLGAGEHLPVRARPAWAIPVATVRTFPSLPFAHSRRHVLRENLLVSGFDTPTPPPSARHTHTTESPPRYSTET